MKKKMILISVIGLFFLMFPLFAAADLFELTSGTPVTQPTEIFFNEENYLYMDDAETVIHSYTFQELDNGYYRFTLDYTMPEELEVYIGYSSDDESDPVRMKVTDTISSRSTLQFDIEKDVLESAWSVFVDFFPPDGYEGYHVSFDPSDFIYSNSIMLTSGTPVGEATDIAFSTTNELSENQNETVIHSYTYQELNNGYYRFSLEYTMPAGRSVYIFDTSNGDIVSMWGPNTVSSRSTLQFDIEKNTLLSVGGISVNFFTEDTNRFFVFFQTEYLLNPIILTSGTPIGEVTDIPFGTYNDGLFLNDNEAVIHSYTYQKLDNGYYRFSLDYTMPAGLLVEIYNPYTISNPLDGNVVDMWRADTASSRRTLQFDIEKNTLFSVEMIQISFFSSGYLRFSVSFWTDELNHPIILTSGTPIGEVTDIPFGIYNEGLFLNDNEAVIHSYTYQKLDNGYYRFSLDYTIPAGLKVMIFDLSYNTISMYGINTVSSRSTLQFDIEKNTLLSVEGITINIAHAAAWFSVEFDRNSILPIPVHFALSDGIPVSNAQEIDYRVSDEISVHSYSCQQLNNGKTRFTLSFTAPAGFHMSVYNYPDEDILQIATGVTCSEKTTVQFDLNKGDLLSADKLCVKFFHYHEIDHYYFITHDIDNDFFLEELSTLYLPTSLTSIESYAFSNLACQAVIIPEGCTAIDEYAFAGCADLLYVRIPSTVENYPENAFEGCNESIVIDWTKE